MKVILRKDVDKLGVIGDVVDVADGFARNFLVPKGMAYQATKGGLRQVEEEKKLLAKQAVKTDMVRSLSRISRISWLRKDSRSIRR
jgi:large subunit ribosomal protein L9